MPARYTKPIPLCHLNNPPGKNTYRTSAAGDEMATARIGLSGHGVVLLQWNPIINFAN
jgi:hypothetical protein